MAYVTKRGYARAGPICIGVVVLIAGAVLALLANSAHPPLGSNSLMIGAALAIIGVVFIIIGFAATKKKRDSVLTKVDTRKGDVPPPPPRD
jgi:arginine exporter protein ArgO